MLKLALLLGLAALVIADDTSVVHDHCKYDIVILLDSSGSIEDNNGNGNFERVKSFAMELVTQTDSMTQVGTNTRLAVTRYSNVIANDVTLEESLTSSQITERISESPFMRSETRMYAAVQDARRQFNEMPRPEGDAGVTKAVILFTDGVPSSSVYPNTEKLDNVVRLLRDMMDENIYVLMVGIHNVNDTMLDLVRTYTNRNGENYGFSDKAEDFDQLVEFPEEVLRHLKIDCSIDDTLKDRCAQEIFFLVDSSGSIGRNLFDRSVKPFAENLVDAINTYYPIGPGQTRVGLTSFSRGSVTLVELEDGTNVDNIKLAIRSMRFSDSWTHLVEFTEKTRDELRNNGRPNVPMRLIIITDGFPTHENRNPRESQENLIQVITDMQDDVHVTLVGFDGDRAPAPITDLLRRLDSVAEVVNIADRGFNAINADSIIEQMDPNCPVQELIPICQTDLVIVLDDTSEMAFTASKGIAENIVTQLGPYVRDGRANVAVVSSDQTSMTGNVNQLMMSSGGSNKLLMALNRAGMALGSFPSNNLLAPNLFRVVLVIHSGVINYDGASAFEADPSSPLNVNSVKDMAYRLLKNTYGANIHSMPLASANEQGLEVLRRLHTPSGSMLDTDANYIDVVNAVCPRYDPCEVLDVALLVDVSSSIDLQLVKESVREVLSILKETYGGVTNVAMVSFAEYSTVHLDLENGELANDAVYSYLLSAIDNLQASPMGMTNMARALLTTATMVFGNHGDRPSGKDIVIIFSDGEVNTQTYMNGMALRDSRGITNSTLLFRFQDVTEGDYTETSIKDMAATDRSRFRVDVSNLIEVDRCPPLQDIPPGCKNLVLIFDSSGSIRDEGNRDSFMHIKSFTASVLQAYYTRRTEIPKKSAGAVQYSNGVEVVLPFDNYRDRSTFGANAINNAMLVGGLSNMGAALERASEIITDTDPSDVSIILVSDGEFNRGRNPPDYIRELSERGFSVNFMFVTAFYEDKQNEIKAALPSDEHWRFENDFSGLLSNSEYLDWAFSRICTV